MDFIVWGVLFVLGYPVIVAAMFARRKDDTRTLTDLAVLRKQVAELESRLGRMEVQGVLRAEPAARAPAPVSTPAPVQAPVPVQAPAPVQATVPPPLPAVTESPPPLPPPLPPPMAWPPAQDAAPPPVKTPSPPPPRAPSPPPRAPSPPPAWLLAAKNWLFTGNLVAKFGLLILFIGVSFLLKYAAERVTVPIELRLAGVVVADLALLYFGWRIREKRRGIGLPVQGAAIAILMLVVFGAFQRYHLIPGGFAFAALFLLTAFTCILAVLQNAVWLAVFGICGGFAAPLLVSTGSGNYVGLFSYYALLNAGVLAIALKRSWRSLNLLGFAFTFGIGTAWGVLKYTAGDYLPAQGFLALFFLFYVAVAIAYAGQQALRLKHYVDATLVFATPVVVLGLQYGLVKDKAYGMAISALVLGLFYTGLALVLWRARGDKWRMLTESFLALGVVFGTLALPFALDSRWTSGAWALEGAGIVWIGLRQKRPLTWGFGLLVQAGACLSFMGALTKVGHGAQGDSNVWLGFLLLAGAAFAMAVAFRKQVGTSAPLSANFSRGANVLLALAALWLLGGAWGQLIVSADHFTHALGTLFVASALVVAGLLVWLARSSDWRVARGFAVAAQLMAGVALAVVLGMERIDWRADMLPGALMIFISSMISSRYLDKPANPGGTRALSTFTLWWGAFWWYVPVLTKFVSWVHERESRFDHGQLYAVGAALSALAFAHAARRLAWPKLRQLSIAAWLALAVLTAVMLFEGYGNGEGYGNDGPAWATLLAVWLGAEYLMAYWQRQGWTLRPLVLKTLHVVRSAGPWLLLWPTGHIVLGNLLSTGDAAQDALLVRAGWQIEQTWAGYLTAWLMMAVLFWLLTQARRARWPTTPLSSWYGARLLPPGIVLSLLLVIGMNLNLDGSMAPLPYVPLLNPLDLSTAFAAVLAVLWWRTQAQGGQAMVLMARAGKVLAYLWFNLVLLRTASHVLHIPYTFDALMASQTVQAMLSLTWSLTALVVMRRAGSGGERAVRLRRWLTGAALLAVVVAKLFIADLDNVGSVGRIVSFVGVGLMMLVIGYLAPFPSADAAPAPAPPPAADPDLPPPLPQSKEAHE